MSEKLECGDHRMRPQQRGMVNSDGACKRVRRTTLDYNPACRTNRSRSRTAGGALYAATSNRQIRSPIRA